MARSRLICGFMKNISSLDPDEIMLSTMLRINTPKLIPAIPAIRVSTRLSIIIWLRMLNGVAPRARRTPISCVRSRMVTIIMLLTPTTPAKRVPKPTISISTLMPRKRLANILNWRSRLKPDTASGSVGDMSCSFLMIFLIRSSNDDTFVLGLEVMASTCT